jgi:probable rRNA maturation factor
VSVSIQNRQRHAPVSAARLRRLAARALAAVGRRERDVHIAVVDDREIRRLNRRYLGVRGATDVLAFDLALGASTPASSRPRAGSSRAAPSRTLRERPTGRRARASSLLGEVVISGETAARQAARLRVSAALELELLLVHGLLHLAGYDDHAPAEARAMHERAREILASSRRRPLPDRLFTGLLVPGAGTARTRREGIARTVDAGTARTPSPSERERVGVRVGASSRAVGVRGGRHSRALRARRGRRA